jgi:hypothetical protein
MVFAYYLLQPFPFWMLAAACKKAYPRAGWVSMKKDEE